MIDIFLRMYIEPQVKLAYDKLSDHLEFVREQRETAFATVAHIDRSVFSSQHKFKTLLENLGVEVPMKIYRDGRTIELRVPSGDRNRFLKGPRLH